MSFLKFTCSYFKIKIWLSLVCLVIAIFVTPENFAYSPMVECIGVFSVMYILISVLSMPFLGFQLPAFEIAVVLILLMIIDITPKEGTLAYAVVNVSDGNCKKMVQEAYAKCPTATWIYGFHYTPSVGVAYKYCEKTFYGTKEQCENNANITRNEILKNDPNATLEKLDISLVHIPMDWALANDLPITFSRN